MKSKRKTLAEVLRKQLKDPEFRLYFERERAISDLARMVRDARLRAGLTQAVLARRAKTSQSVIARLESGADQRTPSLQLLERIAHALKARLILSLDYHKAA